MGLSTGMSQLLTVTEDLVTAPAKIGDTFSNLS